MLTVAIPKRNKLQNIIVLTPKDGYVVRAIFSPLYPAARYDTCLSELS